MIMSFEPMLIWMKLTISIISVYKNEFLIVRRFVWERRRFFFKSHFSYLFWSFFALKSF